MYKSVASTVPGELWGRFSIEKRRVKYSGENKHEDEDEAWGISCLVGEL